MTYLDITQPVKTTAPDTAKGQLTHEDLGGSLAPKANIPALASDSLTIPRRLLKTMWRKGLIDNGSYCVLAMYHDGIGKDGGMTDFDMNAFAVKWAEHWQEEKTKKSKKGADVIEVVDKEKQLTDAQIEAVLGKFEDKTDSVVEREIQLNLDWGMG